MKNTYIHTYITCVMLMLFVPLLDCSVNAQTTIFTSGFETGNSTFTGSAGTSTTITQPTASNPNAGTNSGKYVATGNNTVFTGSIITGTTITFTTGKYYRFTVWAKKVNTPSSTLKIKKSATATNAAMVSASGSDILLNGSSLNVSSTTYTKFVSAIQASATESDKYVGIQIVSDNAGGQLSTAYIDDFTIEESTTPFAENYCQPTSNGSSTAGHITNITFPATGGINRTSTYDDYVNTGLNANITTNETYTLSASKTTTYSASITTYIDWDGNGVYSDGINSNGDNEKVMTYSANTTATQTQSVTVPSGAQIGSTFMRVIFKYSTAVTGPCDATSTYYDVEDYSLTIVAGCTTPITQATSFTSSSITTNSMTVGWTRGNGDAGVVVVARATGSVNADVENGTSYTANVTYGSGTQIGTGNYVVYVGTGTSVNVTGLSALTSYYFAVYEYNTTSTCYLKSELTGNATTLAATYTTTATGNWNATGTWAGGVVPTANENAVIANGHTVTITAVANCNNLTVGQGTSGILIFETTTARTLTVGGDVTIASGGTFQSASTGTQTGHSLSIAGSITNNGTLDFSTNSNTAASGITFTGSNNTTFSGTGGTTDLKTLIINKGTSTTPVLELSPSNFTIQGVTTDVAGFLTLTNGTFKISGSFTMTNRVFTSAGYTIGSTTGLNLNNANFTVAAQTSSAYINAGILTINAGTYNSGTAIDNGFFYYAGSTITINGGNMNIAGNLYPMTSGTITYTQTGGTLTVCTVGNTAAQPAFYTTTGSTFNMSAGSIVNRLVNTGASKYDFDNSAGTRTITGGTLQLGDASSGTAKIYVITGYIPNLLVTNISGNHTAKWYNFGATNNVLLTTTLQSGTTLDANTNSSAVTFTGDITMGTSSTFLGGTNTQNVSSNWINNGTLTPSTGTINFNGGSAQTISGSSTTSFYNLIIANTSGGVSLAVNSTVTNTLTLTSGKLTVQGYTLAIGTNSANGSISGGSSTAYIVAYDNSGTIGYVKRFVNSNAAYSYPIGDATNYVPLTFTLTSATLSSAYLTIFNKATKVTGLNPSITTNYIARHWNVTESGFTTPTYSISYTYVDGDIVGSETGMLPVKKSGSTWNKPTGSLFTDGTVQGTGSFTAASNLLSWTGLTTFSLFGGVVSAAVALPIELVSFAGKKDGNNNELKWTTATELNNDYFTIEKTLDGTNFEIVGIENGAGNSNQYVDYSMIDYDVREVINYYRLKQTDFDGKYDFSELISIDNRTNNKEIAFITNILGQEVNENYRGLVVIVYSDGTSVKVIQ